MLLLVLALLHASLGVFLGLTDGGDYGLLWVALPMMVLTGAAALAVLPQAGWLRPVPVILTSITVALAMALVPMYGLGVYHLPQSVLALTVTLLRSSPQT